MPRIRATTKAYLSSVGAGPSSASSPDPRPTGCACGAATTESTAPPPAARAGWDGSMPWPPGSTARCRAPRGGAHQPGHTGLPPRNSVGDRLPPPSGCVVAEFPASDQLTDATRCCPRSRDGSPTYRGSTTPRSLCTSDGHAIPLNARCGMDVNATALEGRLVEEMALRLFPRILPRTMAPQSRRRRAIPDRYRAAGRCKPAPTKRGRRDTPGPAGVGAVHGKYRQMALRIIHGHSH